MRPLPATVEETFVAAPEPAAAVDVIAMVGDALCASGRTPVWVRSKFTGKTGLMRKSKLSGWGKGDAGPGMRGTESVTEV